MRRPLPRAGPSLVTVAGLLGALTLLAQDPRPTNVFREVQEVNVVNVEVVVTDREDRPVHGLTIDDFEVLENGRPIEISNFYAVESGELVIAEEPEPQADLQADTRAEAAPLALDRTLNLIVFVDEANLAARNRNRVLEELRTFMGDHWSPETRAMIASNTGALEIRQPFIADSAAFLQAIESLESSGNSGTRLDNERQQLLRAIGRLDIEAASGFAFSSKNESAGETVESEVSALVPQIRSYAESRLSQVIASLGVLNTFTGLVAGLPGRKVVIYVSDGLPARPAEALFEGLSRRLEVLPDGPNMFSSAAESSQYDATPKVLELLAQANANQVTFYTIDASDPGSNQRGSAASGGRALGSRGAWNSQVASTEQAATRASLGLLAEGTGGRMTLERAFLADGLDSMFTDLGNFYSLGYVADSGDLEEREIQVKVKRDGVEVRHRSSFRDRSNDEKMVQRTLSALLADADRDEIPISLEALEVTPGDKGTFIVPVQAKIPLGKLVLLPGESSHDAQVSLFVAVMDEDGRTSEVAKHLCPIRIPNSELLVALGREASCGVRLQMRQGRQTIAVGIMDELALVSSTAKLQLTVGL